MVLMDIIYDVLFTNYNILYMEIVEIYLESTATGKKSDWLLKGTYKEVLEGLVLLINRDDINTESNFLRIKVETNE